MTDNRRVHAMGTSRVKPTHLLYLHGFRSSPRSAKAQVMAAWMREHAPEVTWWCPQLPPSPAQAIAGLEAGLRDWPRDRMAIVGSSLGGFYATVLAERLGCPAALLNPAVDPARDLARYIGETKAWHSDDAFYFAPGFVTELRDLRPSALTDMGRYFALLAKGDEVLDWREMAARYEGGERVILEGSDHAISEFDTLLPLVVRFLGLA